MTVQAANRNANQHHPNGTNSKFPCGDLNGGKNTIGMKYEPQQQKVHIVISYKRNIGIKSIIRACMI